MKHQSTHAADVARGATFVTVQQSLAALAAGLDVRFVHAAGTLASVIDTVDRVSASLDSILNAIDEQTAGTAVNSLRESAGRLLALPAIQDERVADIGIVRRATAELNTHAMQIQEVLRILRVNGVNLRIAAGGSPEFARSVADMFQRFDVGDEQLKRFVATIRDLAAGVVGIQRSARLVAVECTKVIPLVPERLADDAFELEAHQVLVAATASQLREIARDIQGRVAVVLGTLQIGDISRQRIEHVVAAMQIVASEADAAAQNYALRLIVAQLDDIAADLDRETKLLINALRALGPDTERLLALTDESEAGEDSSAFLHRLERGITEVEALTGQLHAAERQTAEMSVAIADTLDDLAGRLDAVRAVRTDVERIAVGTRLQGERLGGLGHSVAAVAEEVSGCAERLNQAVNGVAWAMRELGVVSLSIRHRHDRSMEMDPDRQLARSLALIREACRRTDQGISEGVVDARDLVETLGEAGEGLTSELEIAGAVASFASELRALTDPDLAVAGESEAVLRSLLPRVEALYTMAREREVHQAFLLPGMALSASDAEELSDGLF